MKHRTKSILIVGLVVVLIVSGTAIGYFKKNNKSGGDNLYTEYKGYAPEGSYSYYLENHSDVADAGSEFTIGASENYTASNNVQRFDEYQGEKNVVLTPEDGYIEWNVQIPETGFYQMKVKYLTYEGNGLKVERTVKIDGELPYNEAEFLTFERTFKDIEANPAVDINRNDIRPIQEEQKIWQEKMLTDASGYYSEPLKFYLTAGEHKIQLYGEREPLMLSEITFCHAKEAPSYSDYAASHKQVKSENAQTEIFQAEDMYLKSEKSNYPINDRTSSYTQPQQADTESGESSDKIYISDCDSIDQLEEQENIQLITDEGMIKQGKGAFLNSSTSPLFFSAKFKKAVDISPLKGGYVHFSLYVANKNNFVKNIFFEISSSGVADAEELQWEIALSSIKEGWNEIYLSIPSGVKTGKIVYTKVNFFRLYSPNLDTKKGSLDVVIDDIYVTKKAEQVSPGEDSSGSTASGEQTQTLKDGYKETSAANGKMIASLNTVNIFSEMKNLEVTVKDGEHVEGSGAMRVKGAQSASFVLKNPVDISQYVVESGKLHISVYINNPDLLTGATYFYLTSSGDVDEESIYWYLQKYQFTAGWNEIELPFYTSAFKRAPKTDAIKHFTFNTQKPSDGAVIILDNMYVTKD